MTRCFTALSVVASIGVLGALVLLAGCHRRPPPIGTRPNIVLVVSEDWSWPNASAYGDPTAQTPGFDRVAAEGVLFTNAFCAAPSCTPSRLSIVTGQYPHRLGVGANHMVKLPKDWPVYPELLSDAGYFVGHTGKGCNPGVLGKQWQHDPAGQPYSNIYEFLAVAPADSPFCLWVGPHDAHRPFLPNSGATAGMHVESVVVPAYLPDTREVRNDLLDYYFAIRKLDQQIMEILIALEQRELSDNTLLVVTGDNGMAFPRGKANCYDAGVHVPLAIRWPHVLAPKQNRGDFVNLSDLAPTFLEVAGVEIPSGMTGRSILPILTGHRPLTQRIRDALTGAKPGREEVFIERERHALGRGKDIDPIGFQSYPIRGIRTDDFLYLRNLRPWRAPACDPPQYLDIDNSPTKWAIVEGRLAPDTTMNWYYELSCGKRPPEELYDVKRDPYQIENLADNPDYAYVKRRLQRKLARWMEETGDPRVDPADDRWDEVGYYDPREDPLIPPAAKATH